MNPASQDPPKTIGRYEVRKVLGRGTMGVVYQAYDTVLHRKIALKTFALTFVIADDERQHFEQRFLVEARAAAGLTHPNIVVVYDVGRDPETRLLYMALEHLRGKTVEELIRLGLPLPWRETLRTVSRLADALHLAHSRGIVHRDIKPANIMVPPSGEPKIMDFGIAKVSTAHLTTAGQSFGTPSYMSPEQALGKPLDARSDLFSLGTVLYELLTGRKAFPGRSVPEILEQIRNREPPAPSELLPHLPSQVDGVVARALAKNPGDRYPDARTMAEDLESILADSSWPAGTDPKIPIRAGLDDDVRARGATAKLTGLMTSLAGKSTLTLPKGKCVSLAFLSGPRRGAVFTFTRPRVLIGRAGGDVAPEIELDDGEVSRLHAVLECHGDQIILLDLESTNGTIVDGEKIREIEVGHLAEFTVGATLFRLMVTPDAGDPSA